MFSMRSKVALIHEEVKKDPPRITYIQPFRNKYNWEGINIPSKNLSKII